MEKKQIYEVVKAHLMGTPFRGPAQQQQQQNNGQQQQLAGQQQQQQQQFGGGARAGEQATGDTSSILRSLSSKWKFGMA